MTIYRQLHDETEGQPISESEARRRLSHTYEDVNLVFDEMRAGHKVRAMFSIYWIEGNEINEPVPSN